MGYYYGRRSKAVPKSAGGTTSHALALAMDTTVTMPGTVNQHL